MCVVEAADSRVAAGCLFRHGDVLSSFTCRPAPVAVPSAAGWLACPFAFAPACSPRRSRRGALAPLPARAPKRPLTCPLANVRAAARSRPQTFALLPARLSGRFSGLPRRSRAHRPVLEDWLAARNPLLHSFSALARFNGLLSPRRMRAAIPAGDRSALSTPVPPDVRSAPAARASSRGRGAPSVARRSGRPTADRPCRS